VSRPGASLQDCELGSALRTVESGVEDDLFTTDALEAEVLSDGAGDPGADEGPSPAPAASDPGTDLP